jgi:hypothetical protein
MRTKIEYRKDDKNGEKFHVYTKDFFFDPWLFRGQFKSISAAEEFAKSRDKSIVYEGIYENGAKIGMTGWEEEEKEMPAYNQVNPTDDNMQWIHKGKK